MNRAPVTDVVVVLPGILGSVLEKGTSTLWNTSRGALFKNLIKGAGPVQELALTDPDADDGVRATRLIGDVHMIPWLWTIDGYARLSDHITGLPGVVPGENFFQFPYDWRRDNRKTAERLAVCTRGWLEAWRKREPQAQLVLIGHSMGGLVARYFLEVLGGWRETRALLTIGTPFRGSVNALDFIVNGFRKGIGPATLVDLSTVVRSLPSAYQLLPEHACWEDPNGRFNKLIELPAIPGLDASLLRSGLGFHEEIAAAERDNLKLDEYVEKGYRLIAVSGIAQPTLQSVKPLGGGLKALKSYAGRDRDGDGTVMRESAVPASVAGWGVSQQHASLQNDRAVLSQVEFLLTEPKDFLRAPKTEHRFGLDFDDAYLTGEPIHLKVPAESDMPPLEARLEDTASHQTLDQEALREGDDGCYEAELGPLSEGTYRLVVEGEGVAPVTGVLTVLSPA